MAVGLRVVGCGDHTINTLTKAVGPTLVSCEFSTTFGDDDLGAPKTSNDLGANEAIDDRGGVGLDRPGNRPPGKVINPSDNVKFIGSATFQAGHGAHNI